MFTRCAHCDTWFRVGPDAVRAAHGQVRCGFCGEEFNALKTLCDSLPADAFHQPYSDSEPPAETAAGPITPEPGNEITSDAGEHREPAADFTPPAEPDTPEEIAAAESETVAPEAWQEPPAENSAPADFDEPETPAAPGFDVTGEHVDRPRGEVYPPVRITHRKRRGSPLRFVWIVGSAVLVAALLAQILIYKRTALRDNPVTGPAIERLYAAFGHPLPPRRDLAVLAISHAQVRSAPGAALLVTATLTNHADFAQPYPILEVSLTNRFGNPVGRGLFSARDYLPHPSDAATNMRAGQAQSVRLKIADPGTKAVGFVIVPCLRTDAGPKCAERPPRE